MKGFAFILVAMVVAVQGQLVVGPGGVGLGLPPVGVGFGYGRVGYAGYPYRKAELSSDVTYNYDNNGDSCVCQATIQAGTTCDNDVDEDSIESAEYSNTMDRKSRLRNVRYGKY